MPWEGRDEDKTDDSVWAVTCLLTRAGFRKRGVGRALARATVDFARDRGARAIEGYPIIGERDVSKNSTSAPRPCSPTPATPIVSRPGTRRLVMRIDF